MEDKSGPAYPQEWSTFEYQGDSAYTPKVRVYHRHPGMTLRDWFAGQALMGVLAEAHFDASGSAPAWRPEPAAVRAYALADAMLKARSA